MLPGLRVSAHTQGMLCSLAFQLVSKDAYSRQSAKERYHDGEKEVERRERRHGLGSQGSTAMRAGQWE